MADIVVFLRSQPRFGDQIVAYPVLSLLKKVWEDKRVRVVSCDPVGHFYTSLPWVDEFVQADAFIAQLRALPHRAHAALNLHHSSERYPLISLLRRPVVRMGFDNDRFCDRVWTHSHRKDINEYIGLANMRLLATHQDHDPEQTARSAFIELAHPHIDTIRPADIVLIPGGGSGPFKRWHLDHYLALADLLQRHLGGSGEFTFVLGPDEDDMRGHINSLGRADFKIAFRLPAAQLAAMMRSARLVVANDCGPSHIAQGLCVPYVGVFNEPNPEWFWTRRYTRDVVPDNGTTDINSIEPARVFQACLSVLGEPRFS